MQNLDLGWILLAFILGQNKESFAILIFSL